MAPSRRGQGLEVNKNKKLDAINTKAAKKAKVPPTKKTAAKANVAAQKSTTVAKKQKAAAKTPKETAELACTPIANKSKAAPAKPVAAPMEGDTPKKELKMNVKNLYSRAYHQTVNACRKQGIDIDAAKAAGRKAAQEKVASICID